MTAPPTAIRRRIALVASAAVLAAGALAVAGCGGDEAVSAPVDTAASYVPAGTPMYFEVTTEADGPQWNQVRELAQLFPAYPTLLAELQDKLDAENVDFERDVRPLLGARAAVGVTSLDAVDEVANAATGTTSTPDPAAAGDAATDAVGESALGVVDIADGARADVEALIERTGGRPDGELDGASVFLDPEGDDTTVIGVTDEVMLVADRREDLAAALEANAAGGEATLAGTDAFTDTLGKLPDDVFGLMYVDVGAVVQAGGETLPQDVQFGSLGDLQDGHVGAAVIAEPEGLRIKGVATGVTAYENVTPFSPSLIANAPADALAYAEIANISGLIRGELDAFRATAEPEALEQIDAFGQAIPQILGVTVDQLAALGEGQQALIAVPGATPAQMPGIAVLSQVADGAQASATLDSIREATPALLGMLGGSEPGTTPNLWVRVPLPGGLQGWQLPVGEDFSVVYAVQGDLVVIGSSRQAVAAVLNPETSLAESPAYSEATAGMPESVTSVAWVNIRQVTQAAAAAGAFDDAPPESRANLRPLRSVAYWDAGGDEPAFEAFITIGE
jgi:hypothetical protein